MATRKIVSKDIAHAATSYIGVDGEIWVDTVTNLLKVSDGSTPGGTVITTDGTVTTWANIADINNASGPSKVAVGNNAGQTSQGNLTVAIGTQAGQDTQSQKSIAIGSYAGMTTQGSESLAIGHNAGKVSQGNEAVAIGNEAAPASQHANSIVLNASGTALNTTQASEFVVKPVRDVSGSLPSGFKQLAHNATTGEIISYG